MRRSYLEKSKIQISVVLINCIHQIRESIKACLVFHYYVRSTLMKIGHNDKVCGACKEKQMLSFLEELG